MRIRSSYVSEKGPRPSMEDAHTIIDNLKSLDISLSHYFSKYDRASYYGVFDGHGGDQTAKILSRELLEKIIYNFPNHDISESILQGFSSMDNSIMQKVKGEDGPNGSTCVCTLILDNTLYTANVGDSEGIMISIDDHLSARYTLLTEIHKPSVPAEKERIEGLGGQIYGGRVCGILAVSRAFGDYFFKYPNVQANLVSAVPYIQENQLTPKDQYLILACDGLWDVLRYEVVLSLVYKAYQMGLNPNEIARKLTKKAAELGSQDNVTVVVVQFKWQDEKVVFEPPINPDVMENWEVERFVPRNIYQGYGVQRIFLELQDIPKCTPHWLKLSREVVEDSLKLLLFPKTGYWKGRKFKFTIHFSQNYPKEAPRIICHDSQADHPLIDTITGDVSLLDILNEEWTDSKNIHDLIFGLDSLFTNTKLSPNPEVLSRKT